MFYIERILFVFNSHILGIDEFRASFLVSAIGITNTVGRVFFGFLSDRKCVNRMLLYSTALLICGAATCVSPFLKSFETLLVYSMVYGAFSGNIVTNDTNTISKLGIAGRFLEYVFHISRFKEILTYFCSFSSSYFNFYRV